MQGSEWITLIGWWVILLVILWFLFILPQQKQRREREKFLESLKPGDEVTTYGGLCGRILSVDGDMVTLRIADGVNVRVVKTGIQRRLDKEEVVKLRTVLKKGGG